MSNYFDHLLLLLLTVKLCVSLLPPIFQKLWFSLRQNPNLSDSPRHFRTTMLYPTISYTVQIDSQPFSLLPRSLLSLYDDCAVHICLSKPTRRSPRFPRRSFVLAFKPFRPSLKGPPPHVASVCLAVLCIVCSFVFGRNRKICRQSKWLKSRTGLSVVRIVRVRFQAGHRTM